MNMAGFAGGEVTGSHGLPRPATPRLEVNGVPLERMLKKLKRYVLREGILKDVKRHMFYTKPSEQRRLKAKAAASRRAKVANKLMRRD